MVKIALFKLRFFNILLIIFFGCFFCTSEKVQAAAWWGEGYRSPQWVMENGGTIIYYTIEGKKASDKYKARMYQGGEYVEVEYGSSGWFDDALRGSYSIVAYEDGKVKGKVSVSACPGGKVFVHFDVKKKKGTVSGCQKVVKTAADRKREAEAKARQEAIKKEKARAEAEAKAAEAEKLYREEFPFVYRKMFIVYQLKKSKKSFKYF